MPGDRNEISDEEMVRAAQRGDPAALATLYRRHAPGLLHGLTISIGDRAEAEDVLHDAFLRIVERRVRYEEQGRFKAWLYTIAVRIARDRARARKRRNVLTPRLADPTGAGESPVDALRRAELLREIDEALSDFPADYAAAFHLRIHEAFSYSEMAEITGDPEGTLRSRVHHALRKVRRKLERAGFFRAGTDSKKEKTS